MIKRSTLLALGIWALSLNVEASSKALTFDDLMKFRTIRDAAISDDGAWIVYQLHPDRGDSTVVVRSVDGSTEHRVANGASPVLSSDARWVAMTVEPSLEDKARAEKDDETLDNGLAIVDTASGEVVRLDAVEAFELSPGGAFIAYTQNVEAPEDDEDAEDWTRLVLRELSSGVEVAAEHAAEHAFDAAGELLAYAVDSPDDANDGLFLRRLASPEAEEIVATKPKTQYTSLTWAPETSELAFLESGEDGSAGLWIWNGRSQRAVEADLLDGDRIIPDGSPLSFSGDGERIFFGVREQPVESEQDEHPILAEREVDVWHWNDPLINTHQKMRWKDEKDRTYMAVLHRSSNKVVLLADGDMRELEHYETSNVALGVADTPYLKERTWNGSFRDLYAVRLDDGKRTLVAEHQGGDAELSPDGRFVAYYADGDWHLFDVDTQTERNLTAALDVPFADEDHDYPSEVPGYGIAGWVAGDRAVLINDKYDIWSFPTGGDQPKRLTAGAGRDRKLTFRIATLDPDQKRDDVVRFEDGAPLLLTSYDEMRKNWGLYRATIGKVGVEKLVEEAKKFQVIAKARNADRLLYTRESYTEFPDLWTASLDLTGATKLSDANPQIDEFAWGEPELVEWSSLDGKPLQGVLIKPGNYEPGKRYPVLVYFYRFFSQRLYEFNEPVVNHRPSFPLYASNGYAVFLPDIRFEIGQPGFAATKSLVPGVQKLVDMGVADPDAIGLHGHSWSGYQTAFIITQTNMFAAAVAGAPVSNMTSAYSGIRWASGLARQFQYEKTQSRIGGSLWQYPERYIENSPVFFADRIETPLLIQFGDEDGAVPWYQGIELYLAMRRLGKECIFLQYRGEPHHLQKYANKLDYAIKMKEFFDHHLKGTPAPAWMTEGVPYAGQ